MLLDDPTIVPGAVEELLRFLSVNQGEPRRVAAADTEVAGCPLHKGDGVIAALGAANFDPTVLDRETSAASELDIRRAARNHVAFG
ncbi:hypothetical protein [Pseudonocardia sp. NPDC049154]|uniref:hypothetical protein n=1 Tax=Pseudonocardia sp. NPDC049154 TaxID=3155501 RepID=UPI0033F487E9